MKRYQVILCLATLLAAGGLIAGKKSSRRKEAQRAQEQTAHAESGPLTSHRLVSLQQKRKHLESELKNAEIRLEELVRQKPELQREQNEAAKRIADVDAKLHKEVGGMIKRVQHKASLQCKLCDARKARALAVAKAKTHYLKHFGKPGSSPEENAYQQSLQIIRRYDHEIDQTKQKIRELGLNDKLHI